MPSAVKSVGCWAACCQKVRLGGPCPRFPEGHAPWQPASEGWARVRVDDRRLSSATAGVGPPAFQITFLINLFLRLCPISRFHPNKARAFHVSSVRGALHVSASQVSVL